MDCICPCALRVNLMMPSSSRKQGKLTRFILKLVNVVHSVTKIFTNKVARLRMIKKELDDILVDIAEMFDT